jgi:hypothetical protein
MKQTNRIPACWWPVLRRQVADIKAATKAGTPNFEEGAKQAGSKIYTCRYREIGKPWCDNISFKDGRTLITEQNLQYFPEKIRYYYAD